MLRFIFFAGLLAILASSCGDPSAEDRQKDRDTAWTARCQSFRLNLPIGSEVLFATVLRLEHYGDARTGKGWKRIPARGMLLFTPIAGDSVNLRFRGIVEGLPASTPALDINCPTFWRDSTLFLYVDEHGEIRLSTKTPPLLGK